MRTKKISLKPGLINYSDFEYGKKLEGSMKNRFLTEKLFLKPLYRKVSIKDFRYTELFPMNNVNVELFCKDCMCKRNFQFAHIGEDIAKREYDEPGQILTEQQSKIRAKKAFKNYNWIYFVGKAECEHSIISIFERVDNNFIRKIGQSPSPEEMNENIQKPPIDRFIRMYMKPFFVEQINRISNKEVRKIKLKYRLNKYNPLYEKSMEDGMEFEEFRKLKDEIEISESKELVEIYNKLYNIPYGKAVERFDFAKVQKRRKTAKLEDVELEELEEKITVFLW